MNTSKKVEEKSTDAVPVKSTGNLMSFEDFDHFFDDFLSRRWPRLSDWNFPTTFEKGIPKIDILDRDDEVEVQAALPGVKKEDLEVSIVNQTITIRTSSKEEKKEEGRYFRREISRGEFQRTLSLPHDIDGDNAKASFENGILKVTIPKTEKSKRKNIEIQ